MLRRHGLPLVLSAAVAFLLAMHGGTPQWHPDRLTSRAVYTIENGGHPEFFYYPALLLYLHGAVELAVDELGPRLLDAASLPNLERWPWRDLPGHTLTALFAVVGALSVYGTAYLLTRSRRAALLGALLLACSPLWNANAHFITVDLPVAALAMLTVLAACRLVERPDRLAPRHALLLGGLVGLTASAKYNGALVAVSVAAALLAAARPFVQRVVLTAIAGAASALVFLLVNPFAWLDYPAFRGDFDFEIAHAAKGHFGYTAETLYHHLTTSLRQGWGWPLIALSAAGALALVFGRRHRAAVSLAVLGFPIAYGALLASTRGGFQRYAVPLLPMAAVLAAVAVHRACGRRRAPAPARAWIGPAIAIALVAVGWGGCLTTTVRGNLLLGRTDTISQVRSALLAEPGLLAELAVGAGPHLGNGLGNPAGLATLRRPRDLDAMMVDSFSHDRYVYDRQRIGRIDFTPFAAGRVLVLSPFDLPREAVPFAPGSVYFPYPPDLAFRTRHGPYVEIYLTDLGIETLVADAFARAGVPVALRPAPDGYYYRMLAHRWPPP